MVRYGKLHLYGIFYNIFRGSVKDEYLMKIWDFFFLFLQTNICCGYLIEAPRPGTSNEHPQHIFRMEKIRKISQNYHEILP